MIDPGIISCAIDIFLAPVRRLSCRLSIETIMPEYWLRYKAIFLFLSTDDEIPFAKSANDIPEKMIAIPLLVVLIGSLTIRPINKNIIAIT